MKPIILQNIQLDMMLSFHPSAPQPYYHSSPIYSGHRLAYPDQVLYSPLAYEPSYPSYFPRVIDPKTRYRRALAEYLTAEEEYNAVLRAREEAVLRARAEAFRQERARLLRARQFKQALARARAHALASKASDDLSLPRVAPVVCSPPERCGRSLPDVLASRRPHTHDLHVDGAGVWKELLGSLYDSAHQPAADRKVCGVAIISASRPDTSDKAQPPHNAKESQVSAPTLESLLRERLQRRADDEEVQDVVHAILRYLGQPTPMTGVSEPSPAAPSPEVSRHFKVP
jgi:hypothetical protein